MTSVDAECLKYAFLAAWNQGDTSPYRALLHPDYVRHAYSSEDGADATGFLARIAETRLALPDLVSAVEDVVVAGDRVVMRWSSRGTHTGTYQGVPPTRRPITVWGVTFSRFADGRVVEEWVTWDSGDLLAAAGVHPAGHGPSLHGPPSGLAELPDQDLMKQVNRRYPTGVTIVATTADGVPRGLAVNAYASISLDPPIVMVAVNQSSSSHDPLFACSHFSINVVSVDQLDLVRTFASRSRDKFAQVEWSPGTHGSPGIAGSSAVLEVEVRERLRASTHTIFIGRVVAASVGEASPMVYAAGDFFDSRLLLPLTAEPARSEGSEQPSA